MDQPTGVVLSLLARGIPIQTRLREGGCGDSHDCPGALLLRLPDGVYGDGVPAILEGLERDRVVLRTEGVHHYDASEYVVTWTLAPATVRS